MSLAWSPKQQQAIAAVTEWLTSDQQIFRLFGYAGTGKTTLAKHLASLAGAGVRFAAFTGKAAHVLQTKGCPATTIHSLIYLPREKSRLRLAALKKEQEGRAKGDLVVLPAEETDKPRVSTMTDSDLRIEIERERKNVDNPSFCLNFESDLRECSLLVLDEVSMVDDDMAADLLSFGVKILALGDPAQLPPIGKGGFFTNPQPDFLLTEVHRQAEGDPIIALATTVREGGQLFPGDGGGETRVISKAQLKANPQLAIEADQVLVGMNKTRRTMIEKLREAEGRTSPLPEPGDRVVCLRNNRKKGILNGQIFEVVEAGAVKDEMLTLRIRIEGESDALPISVKVHEGYFTESAADMKKKFECDRWGEMAAQAFDFANALTVHKSQGSQWENVLVYDESWIFDKKRPGHGARHLYTAITRAARRLIVVV